MGTSVIPHVIISAVRDHPHAYGDKFPIVRRISKGLGSSPRVWGQVIARNACQHLVRIIPTRMGTSLSTTSKSPLGGDHPHAYGDKIRVKICCAVTRGSSPRVWGQGIYFDELYLTDRIIPTRMGTSRY